MTRESNGLIGDIEKKHARSVRYLISEKTLHQLKHVAGPLALLTALMIYTALGGLIFRQLELPSEILNSGRVKADLTRKRNHLVNQILNERDTINFKQVIEVELHSYENAVQTAAQGGFLISSLTEIESFKDLKDGDIIDLSSAVTERWSILQAMFFASTVLTTIGYGNVVPLTDWGRVFCIFYAFVGIPLTLTAIAAWGKLFAETVNNLADKMRRRLPPLMTRLIPSNNTGRRSLGAFAAVVLLFIYLSCGAAMFMLWEDDWNFFDGFYFWFVTMTTIGFGDLVPKKPKYMLLCSLYILVGLALTGTIIELVRMQYNQSWQRLQALRGPVVEALKKLGEQAGGDMSALQLDLKKILAVASLPKLRKRNGKEMEHTEWEEAVQAVLKEIEASASQNQNQKIVRIIIYESSV
ncbi:TWiK family of potassium channels protein 7 isoform X2 [Diachasma alloeum]|uniref:TWiK family of potassium channels protein 7 isoform X2 n=1 Tax=Diachasma alloeum TaxID=454923 RepID=UPI0007381921|nr:TWiK family of potassium channels protein 7 isoform X2 [Diachasma alloeum]